MCVCVSLLSFTKVSSYPAVNCNPYSSGFFCFKCAPYGVCPTNGGGGGSINFARVTMEWTRNLYENTWLASSPIRREISL